MIADWETNKVYYSAWSTSDFKPELKRLREILAENDLKHWHIVGTKDYYCRDYMPIQLTKNEFVQFTFKPDYLLNKPKRVGYVTDTDQVLKKNKFLANKKIHKPEIILDGGNVIKSKFKVIITDKVADDNNTTVELVKSMLEDVLKVEVIIIPRYPDEETGHADGLVRFINEDTVLTINLEQEENDWSNGFKETLREAGLKVVSLPKAKSPGLDWRYINYLHIGKTAVVPNFDNDSDKIILPFLKSLFEQNGIKMETLKANNIAKHGGVLNCFTWNIFE